jgi:predicted Fe-Mo cluster-binding NifX family protein
MKIAISTDNGQVSAHFGRCPEITIVEIENGVVKNRNVIKNPGHQPGFLPQFLSDREVRCIVAGGMGMRAQELFVERGISVIVGVSGTVERAIELMKNGRLTGGPSLCSPGAGKGYGIEKSECDHAHEGSHQ